MKVVENDKLIHGMLREELERCRRIVLSIEKELGRLPKGSLHVRKKQYKNNSYHYHYLKYRVGRKSISKHVPANMVQEIKKKLDERQRYMQELKSNKARMSLVM